MALASKKTVYLKHDDRAEILKAVRKCIPLFGDTNGGDTNGGQQTVGNSTYSSRTKHIDPRFLCLKGLVKGENITTHHVAHDTEKTGKFTKGLYSSQRTRITY